MSVSKIHAASTPSGDFAAAWFDDERYLWDDERLRRATSLIAEWTPSKLQLADPSRGATEVLFNPNALAVSERVRAALGDFRELEFLPVEIDGAGTYYVLHALVAIAPPPGCSLRRAPPPSGNIVEIFGFPQAFEPPSAFFRIQQPLDSAAGRRRSCHSHLFANARGAEAIAQTCGAFLVATELIVPG
ncbi:MAG TPA: hypothetical protein VFP50_12095 [Anaeromyxobacteraceae bacterium]|nr:hypothetical protein [Anaeromyxobacteraceae bacterium]